MDEALLGGIVTIFVLLVLGLTKDALDNRRARREAEKLLGRDRYPAGKGSDHA